MDPLPDHSNAAPSQTNLRPRRRFAAPNWGCGSPGATSSSRPTACRPISHRYLHPLPLKLSSLHSAAWPGAAESREQPGDAHCDPSPADCGRNGTTEKSGLLGPRQSRQPGAPPTTPAGTSKPTSDTEPDAISSPSPNPKPRLEGPIGITTTGIPLYNAWASPPPQHEEAEIYKYTKLPGTPTKSPIVSLLYNHDWECHGRACAAALLAGPRLCPHF